MDRRHIARFFSVLVLFVSRFTGAVPAAPAPDFPIESRLRASDEQRFVPGEVLVRWRDGAEPGVLPGGALSTLDVSATTGIARLTVPVGDEVDAARRLAAEPDVAWAQPNYLRRLARAVNDPRFDEQWALPRIHVPEAIRFAVDHGAWVINMSFNGRDTSPALDDAVAYATERGAILVVAAGNEGSSDPSYPGATKPAIAVAATAVDDTQPFYTNFG